MATDVGERDEIYYISKIGNNKYEYKIDSHVCSRHFRTTLGSRGDALAVWGERRKTRG